MKRPLTIWTMGVPKDKQQDVINRVNLILEDKVIERLREILISNLETKEQETFDYDLPNWPYRQAHSNGYREATNDLLNLIRKVDRPNE